MSIETGIVGLKNRGNTCYLNTSIQCLYNIVDLTEYFSSNEYIEDISNRYKNLKKDNKNIDDILFSKEYSKLVNAMKISTTQIEPKSFHEIIQKQDSRFMGYEQQDSQEALALILDKLHDGLKYQVMIYHTGDIENKYDEIVIESINHWKENLHNMYSIVAKLFFGQFIVKTISLEENDNNKLVSKRFEMFNMLTIPIYGLTLYDSLHKYFEKETLESTYFDETENKHIKAYRQIRLMKVPQYLIIILKRYKCHSNGTLYKSNSTISFPIENLDLSQFCDGYDSFDCTLKLISIGCHEGGINGGHYYSICRNKKDKWYKYDDEDVSEYPLLNNKTNVFKYGYILIYENITP